MLSKKTSVACASGEAKKYIELSKVRIYQISSLLFEDFFSYFTISESSFSASFFVVIKLLK